MTKKWCNTQHYANPLNDNFPIDESIVEVMSLEETPLDDGHHRSLFLPIPGDITVHPRGENLELAYPPRVSCMYGRIPDCSCREVAVTPYFGHLIHFY